MMELKMAGSASQKILAATLGLAAVFTMTACTRSASDTGSSPEKKIIAPPSEAVCVKTGMSSFKIINNAHPDEPLWVLEKGIYHNLDGEVFDGEATNATGGKTSFHVSLGLRTCTTHWSIPFKGPDPDKTKFIEYQLLKRTY
jgi:hypothetical protein